MSSPRLVPWLIPETIISGWSTSPSTANLTQSTGVPSVAKPVDPSSNSISSTDSGRRVVMLRAVALRFESGAITDSSPPGVSSNARRSALSPCAWMPSSLVSRTFTLLRIRAELRAPRSVAHVLQVQPMRLRGVAGLGARPALQQPLELLDPHPPAGHREHRADQDPHHVAHERVRLDPVGQHVAGLPNPLGARYRSL